MATGATHEHCFSYWQSSTARLHGGLRRGQPPRAQETSGRIWRSVDWRPAHLHLIYEVYQNRIVDRQLRGELGGKMPTLVRQF